MEEKKIAPNEILLPISIPEDSIEKGGTFVRILRASCLIPQRYIFAIIGLLGISNAFTMRVALNIAITQMVNRTRSTNDHFDPDACPSNQMLGVAVKNDTKPYAIYDWDEETQGFLMSGFYYGYLTTQVLGGFLAERYGGKWVLGIALLSTALFTLMTPFTIRTGGVTWLFILRVLEGVSEGPAIPSVTTMMARWSPVQERALMSAVLFGGGQLGNVLGPLLSGIILADGRDWAYVFYFFGGCGIVWFLFWSVLCFSEPNSHPYISKRELNYLNKYVDRAKSNMKRDPVPWKAILRSPPAWALLAANVGHDWAVYTMMNLPKYSHDVLRFDITTTGLLSGLPFIAMTACSFIFGMISDRCIKNGWHSVKTGRMIYTTVATTGPGICIILASYTGCNRNAAMVYFISSMGLVGGFYCGMKINILDIAPNYAGSVTSFVNTTSTFAGIITPYLTGLLTPDSTLIQWRTAFWVCFAVLVTTNVIYCIWTEGEQQWWDDVRRLGYPAGWKHGPIIKDDNIKPSDPEYVALSKKLCS